MKVLVYSAKEFEIPFLEQANNNRHQLTFVKEPLDIDTAFKSIGHQAIAIFSGDDASSLVLETLKNLEVKFITLRSTGYNNVHLEAAKKYGLRVANVPNYSPHAIAEHAVALLLALNRKIIPANQQVQRHNFLLNGLMGFDLHGKTVGIVGTGNIGSVMAKIMHGFGCRLLGHDLVENTNLKKSYDLQYTDLQTLCAKSDIISLHLPLDRNTYDIIDGKLIDGMKKNAILINTARGALVHTEALIKALKENKIAAYGTDVYEREKGVFFRDNKSEEVKDELLKTLISLPNVLLTPHQAFMTREALRNLAQTTISNIDAWELGQVCENELWEEEKAKESG
ncbi:2-hydroxyacid dehydrogenase [Flagellimonas allohymeniacidonis]|uniref:2-hydroxyacid dehydrogenase n=1 Tax=Flagellimonas allohymeniacidonis TaxID=2517819 RepID=A0A4Q8QIC4_9FLAO|nr:2-hydroxyacid dehydrogenase [Allomuricauda hymeniacidonis]TAI49754.1 2-hydroxyacid dehydrogenase [Allomuricauda hymeniacidonis]